MSCSYNRSDDMPFCPSCGSKALHYVHGLSTPRADNNSRQMVYYCNGENCQHFVVIQKMESGNPNIKSTVRSTVIKPVGRVKDAAKKHVKILRDNPIFR